PVLADPRGPGGGAAVRVLAPVQPPGAQGRSAGQRDAGAPDGAGGLPAVHPRLHHRQLQRAPESRGGAAGAAGGRRRRGAGEPHLPLKRPAMITLPAHAADGEISAGLSAAVLVAPEDLWAAGAQPRYCPTGLLAGFALLMAGHGRCVNTDMMLGD